MRTRALLGAAVVLMLIVSVATIGSNMGFKISIPLVYDGNTLTTNWVSLPYYNSYTDAASIKADIGANFGSVTRWNNTTHAYQTYNGVIGNFTLVKGEMLAIKVKTATVNWIVVGSHDPGFSLSLVYDGNTLTSNWVSVPYHTTATDAAGIKSQIGTNFGSITRWNNTTHAYQTYNGIVGNFSLTPGEGYIIKVKTATTQWTPAHY